ncbi:hypothetical protein Y032_0112g336 [Ancylostoma ceylanicum]|uniref:Calcineurin-like phosphoesterase domain-containing protein n=1 Tax=Ancylostoma ceylanicum TaxID=53326 RepID=A0A016TE72_9BILA|nr:hypothetical protein Y032_0112g336 [Ancylostoma ceylanicum]
MRRWSLARREVEACLTMAFLRSCSSSSNSAFIQRPPHYRKVHKHGPPRNMLEEEFPNAGDASGAGVRLFDYYKTAELVNQLPTIKEKIDFVSPYERPWTRPEKTWHRPWHPALMSTRKAWALPLVPAYFDVLKYYQYLTKTRLVEASLDNYYSGLVPPTASYEKAMQDSLRAILASTRFDSEDERVSAILASLIDEAVFSVAHNVPRLGDFRVAYDVQSECFWVRSGFMFLYDVKEIGSDEVVRKVRKSSKYIGDDRRKLGELAFVSRDRLAVQLRSREPLAPLHSLESDEACHPLFPADVDVTNDVMFSPKVMNLWPDGNPLWQCPGYFVESEETHTYGRIGAKSLSLLDERCKYWDAPAEESTEMWQECAKAQAVASLFTTLCAQAHTHGFTQYTDVTRPFTSQLMLSNGVDFVFAVGQLNTLAINIECDGFDNPKTNVCHVESPIRLYDAYRDGRFYHLTAEGEKEGLNPKDLFSSKMLYNKARTRSIVCRIILLSRNHSQECEKYPYRKMRFVPDVVVSYWPIFLALNTLFFNEYLIYFVKIGFTCDWPCDGHCLSNELRIFLISDTHLLGERHGHWLDKLRREWQMYRSYRSAQHLLAPDAVFFLGDLMDEGQWGDYYTFHRYADRFDSLFGSSGNRPEVHVLAGNHDLGFHYAVSPFRVEWFQERFNRSTVDTVFIKGQPFVLLTSMAMHGDGCKFCHEAEVALRTIGEELACAKRGKCDKNVSVRFDPYRRPILLQHFPLFRVNDDECLRDKDFDHDDPNRNDPYRPTWEALSKESTELLLKTLEPRAVFNGHTHRGCMKRWTRPVNFWEYTVNSFSWRNGDRPSFLLATISEKHVLVDVCHLPHESTVLRLYIVVAVILAAWLLRSLVPVAKSLFLRTRRIRYRSPSGEKLIKSG